jgi:hypothetical protein
MELLELELIPVGADTEGNIGGAVSVGLFPMAGTTPTTPPVAVDVEFAAFCLITL